MGEDDFRNWQIARAVKAAEDSGALKRWDGLVLQLSLTASKNIERQWAVQDLDAIQAIRDAITGKEVTETE